MDAPSNTIGKIKAETFYFVWLIVEKAKQQYKFY